MDNQILEHANALFAIKFKEISRKHQEERKAIYAKAAHQGSSTDSGFVLANQLKSDAWAIGQGMRARLESFKEAFEAARVQPLPEDLQYVLQTTQYLYSQGVATTNQQITYRATGMGFPRNHGLNVEGEAAHYHDEVLAAFNVWRTKVGLARVTQTFATTRIPSLAELKDKSACAADLQSLLDSNKQGRVAVLYIDLDNFKSVNTAKGHDGGDKCIALAASIIGSVVQHKGRVYRLHGTGDEFAVILPNYDESEAKVTAERIRRAVEEQKPGGDISVTTSIGVFIATGGITAEHALTQADQVMYEAKKTKNTIHFA
jgi:diguanylate cyclase (GGDEF)-like protein